MSAPSASAAQYTMYMATVTFGDAKSVTVDLETSRSTGTLTYASCVESLMGTGTYTDVRAMQFRALDAEEKLWLSPGWMSLYREDSL